MKAIVAAFFILVSSEADAWIHGHQTSTQLPVQGSIVTHFDAATVAIANGATVTSWTDTVNGIVANSTVGTGPVYQTSSINSLPSVKFSGGGLCIPTPGAMKTALDSGDFTVFIVYKTFGAATSFGNLLGANAGSANIFYYADGTNTGILGTWASTTVPNSSQSTFSTLGSTAFNATPSYSNSGKFQSFYINGGAYTSTTTANAGTGGNTICLGSNNGNNFPVRAEILDLLVWSVPLTPPQYVQAEKWARDKYAQTYPWAALTAVNVFFGDSITQGVGASDTVHQAAYLAAQTLGLSLGQWHNVAVGGITTSNMGVLAPTWVDPLPAMYGKKTNLVGFEWYNQSFVGGCGAPCPFNTAQTYVAARHLIANQRVVWGTSTAYSGDPNAGRNSYNSSFDATIPNANIDSYMAIHNNVQIGDSSAYAAHTVNWSDGVHLSNTGQPFLATEFVNGIGALPP